MIPNTARPLPSPTLPAGSTRATASGDINLYLTISAMHIDSHAHRHPGLGGRRVGDLGEEQRFAGRRGGHEHQVGAVEDDGVRVELPAGAG